MLQPVPAPPPDSSPGEPNRLSYRAPADAEPPLHRLVRALARASARELWEASLTSPAEARP